MEVEIKLELRSGLLYSPFHNVETCTALVLFWPLEKYLMKILAFEENNVVAFQNSTFIINIDRLLILRGVDL